MRSVQREALVQSVRRVPQDLRAQQAPPARVVRQGLQVPQVQLVQQEPQVRSVQREPLVQLV